MKFKVAYFCFKCAEEVSRFQKFYNDAVCPKCGYRHPNALTIVETIDYSSTLIEINPWWKFWLPRYKRELRRLEPQ